MLWYLLEVLPCSPSNEYPKHVFLWRNKKDISIFKLKKVPYLELCSVAGTSLGPMGVKSSTISLPNHTCTGQA